MNTRNYGSVALLIVLFCATSGTAIAASDEAEINLTGKILDNTCVVDGSGSDLHPVMDTVSAHDLKGKGTILGKRDIKLVLKDCGKDITRGVVITAKGTIDISDTEGYTFKNVAGGEDVASGVGLHFYKSVDHETPFKANGEVTETITHLKEGDNTLIFAAAYVATVGEPVAGDFSTTINLTMAYQ